MATSTVYDGYSAAAKDYGYSISDWLNAIGKSRDTSNTPGSTGPGGVSVPSETEQVNNAINQYMAEQKFLDNYNLRAQILAMLQGGAASQQPVSNGWEGYLNEGLLANYALAKQQMQGADAGATAEIQRLMRDRAANYGTTEARMTARGLGSSNLVNAAVNDVTDTYNRAANDINATNVAQKQAIYAGANQNAQSLYQSAMQSQASLAAAQAQQASQQQNMLFSALLGTF